MRLRNILIVVKDIEKSKKFYHDLFGLDIILDNDGNVILTEGLVLQDEKVWKDVTGKEVVPENNSCELYFEERNIETFTEKLEKLYPETKYVTRLMTYSRRTTKWQRYFYVQHLWRLSWFLEFY